MSVLRNKTFCCYSISKTEFTNLFQIKPIVHRDRGNKIVGGLQKKEKLALLYSTKYKEPNSRKNCHKTHYYDFSVSNTRCNILSSSFSVLHSCILFILF